MQRVANNRNPATDLFGTGKHGFTVGSPTAGVPATTPGAEWFNSIQEELARFCESAGITLDPAKYDQMQEAFSKKMVARDSVVRVSDYVLGSDHAPGFLAAIRKGAETNRRVDISGNWTFQTKCDASGYDVDMIGVAAIDAAAVPGTDPALIIGGKLGASAPLTANAAIGAAGVVCALQPQPGDIIKLESTEAWSTERAYYTKGELCRVLAAVGGTIYLQNPLQDSYTAATTTVTLIQAANVAVSQGLTVKRNADAAGLSVQYARDPAITRPVVFQARERCISLKECIGGYINLGFALADLPATGSMGTNYGLVLESCADTTINGGSYRGGRHGIATGGTYPCRDLKFSKCIVDNDHSSTVYSLDAHANGERFVYEDVFNKNGAVIQAIDCILRGGNWQTVNVNACLSLFPARSVTRYRVEGIWCYNTQAGGKGLTYSNAVSGINMGSLFVESSRLVADIPLQVLPRVADTQFDTISVDERSTLQALGLTAGSGSFIYNNDVVNPLIKRVIIKAKLLAGVLGRAMTVTSNAKTFDYVEISGTTLEHSAADNAVLIQRAKVARFTGNQCAGFGVSLRVELASCDRTITGGNQFSGFTSVGGLYLNGNTENVKLGGDYSDASGGISAGPVFVTYSINERGNKVTYGSTAPTSGAWRLGDICINNAPGGTSGWVYGWECTTAGSPGTWKVIGTLS